MHDISGLGAKCQCFNNISCRTIVLQREREPRVQRHYTRFVGVDLGGGRGKTTALAELRMGARGAEVIEVATRGAGTVPWTDETLIHRLAVADPERVIAIDAPLTQTACGRCEEPVCPGAEACADPAVVWLRTVGRGLVQQVAAETVGGRSRPQHTSQARLAPYAHRATDVVMTYERGLLPLSTLGAANSTITARASHLRRRLRSAGYQLHGNLLEVSPSATIAALCGPRIARGYKRDADPWVTRASILEGFTDLTFAPQSRMAREDVLRNDHCFDAVISAYTAYLWARDGWEEPTGMFEEDGWIFAPP
jgi:predicted nuclease with RNAse H fold